MSRLGKLHLQVPQTRGVEFYPAALERGERSERALKLALAEMYVQGVSTRKVAEITRELCGCEVSSTQVSRAAEALDAELEVWCNRPLGRTPYLMLDARYEKVRHAGSVVDCAVLIAIGVMADGLCAILGVSVSLSEAEVHCATSSSRSSTADCTACGSSPATTMLAGPGPPGLFPQRALAAPPVPPGAERPALRAEDPPAARVARDLRGVWDTPDRAEAERQLAMLVKKYHAACCSWPSGWRITCPRDSPSSPCRPNIAAACGPAIRWNDSTRRSNAAPAWPPSSPTKPRSCGSSPPSSRNSSEDWETGKTYLTMETGGGGGSLRHAEAPMTPVFADAAYYVAFLSDGNFEASFPPVKSTRLTPPAPVEKKMGITTVVALIDE